MSEELHMSDELLSVVVVIGQTFVKNLPISLGLAVVFTALTSFWACNPGKPWWHKLDIITDLCYWFLIPVIGRYLRIGLMVVAAAILFNITTADGLIAFYDNGHGPLAALPLVVQMIIFLVGEDVILYVIMVLTGISPNVLVVLGPLTVAHSAFVHANLDWTLGPFKYVIAGPVFHRWHHTAADRSGEKNFASTFPILDMIFGTFHMPKGELPDRYGVGEREYPTSFTAQLVHPFTQ
jgi:hypothetical protein